MKEEKITTLHPQGKRGVNILKRRYDTIKDFILKTIGDHTDISFEDLTRIIHEGFVMKGYRSIEMGVL